MTREQLDRLTAEIDAVIRELREVETAPTPREISVPLRDLLDALDRIYERNQAMSAVLDRAFAQATAITAAVVGVMHDDQNQNQNQNQNQEQSSESKNDRAGHL